MNVAFARPEAFWLFLLVPLIGVLGVGWGVRRRRVSRTVLGLRLAIVSLMVFGLAEPLLTQGADAASTVFVIDRSRSLADDTAASATTWVADALASAGVTDRAAVVSFGSSPTLSAAAGRAQNLNDDWQQAAATADPSRDFTNIEGAMALARSLPLGGQRRIVLLSDGAENVGTALNQAAAAATDGTPIDVVPLDGVGARDLRLEGATAPSSTWLGEPASVLVSVNTGVAGPGRVELWVDGAVAAAQDVELPEGISSHAFALADLPAGFHALEARVSGPPDGDRYPQNNTLPLSLVVRDQPRIMLIVPPGTDAGLLQGVLERGGADIEIASPLNIPSRLSDLTAYDAFVLDNVPANALTLDQVAGLQEAVRVYGRGLVVLGGTSSYGPGGYAGTVLEETLPVTVRVTDGRQRQRVALLLIMDKSGSMSYDPLSTTGKIEMAKEAVRLASRSLAEGDQVGVIAFNDKQEWIVPLTTIGDETVRARIDGQIAAITPDGGTEILPALSVGLDAIRNVEADARHVVLLSDGKSRTGTRESYQRLLEDALGDRTTLSTIAIGEDADTDLLNFLADQGGGRYHFTQRAEEIPQVTLEEARSAGSQAVIRGAFRPIQTQPSPILSDFAPSDLPVLDGYDFAEAKSDAQVILTSDRDDPVLTKWQFGLGRVVAWTADNGSDFAAQWSTWDRYDEFWAAMLGWTLPDPDNRPIEVSFEREGPEAVINVEAVGDSGGASDLVTTTASITTPSGEILADQPLGQNGPGSYQLRVAAPEAGAYQVELRQEREDGVLTEVAGFAVPPSPELQPAPNAATLLRALAARTGGRVLSIDDPSSVFSRDGLRGTSLQHYQPMWFVPLAAALVLLLLEIGLRMGVFRSLFTRR